MNQSRCICNSTQTQQCGCCGNIICKNCGYEHYYSFMSNNKEITIKSPVLVCKDIVSCRSKLKSTNSDYLDEYLTHENRCKICDIHIQSEKEKCKFCGMNVCPALSCSLMTNIGLICWLCAEK